jgi:ABC-2 type transport system permease protein
MTPFKVATRVLSIVGKELVETIRRPGALVSLVFGPLIILAAFGIGYDGFRRPLQAVVVVPPESGLPTDRESYEGLGEGVELVAVEPDVGSAQDRLAAQTVDLVVVAPSDAMARLEAGDQAVIEVRINVIDPVQYRFANAAAADLSHAVNRRIIERLVATAQDEAVAAGASAVPMVPPEVAAAPTTAMLVNTAPSEPAVLPFFGVAALALILQHMAATLIALSIVRERTTGLFELFRLAPLSTAELMAGKVVAYGLLVGLVAASTVTMLVLALGVPLLADPLALVVVLTALVMASLGLGLLIAAVCDSERQVVQLTLLTLLVSVFFSGFILAVEEFSEPIRTATFALPVTSAIRLLQDVMLRGTTAVPWLVAVLGGLALGFLVASWLLLRRVMARA